MGDDDYYAAVCTRLYETHQRGLLRYCAARLGDALGAEVMQEVFVTMVHSLRTYRPGPPVEGWLYGMAKQKCQQALRNRTRRQDIATAFGKDIWQQLHAEPSNPPGAGLEAREQATRLATCSPSCLKLSGFYSTGASIAGCRWPRARRPSACPRRPCANACSAPYGA